MRKKLGIVLGILLIVIVGGYFYVNYIVKKKVETFLADNLSPHVNLSYGDLYMSTLSGTIFIDGIEVYIENQTDTVIHTRGTINQLILSGFGYADFFLRDQIHFESIDIDRNNLVYFKDKFKGASRTDTLVPDPLASLYKIVRVNNLNIEDTSLTIYDSTVDSVVFHVSKASLSAKNLRTDERIITQRVPITYEQIDLESDSLFLKLSPWENLNLKHLSVRDDKSEMEQLTISPKLSKLKYSQAIPAERDYTKLSIPKVEVMGYDFGFEEDQFYTYIDRIKLQEPDLSIYRDKLVKDDTSFKPLYSQVLRELPLQLMVDSILVENAHVLYEEKVHATKPPGSIEFTNLDLQMARVGNTQAKNESTIVTANGLLQKSKLHIDASFEVQDPRDTFRVQGSLINMPASRINSFVQPNLNIAFEGQLQEIYFDINGDKNTSTTKVKMAYDNFKVDVLRKDNKGVNKLLTGIANIFVKKTTHRKDSKYREGQGNSQRNKDKSIFNFLWISLLSALTETMI